MLVSCCVVPLAVWSRATCWAGTKRRGGWPATPALPSDWTVAGLPLRPAGVPADAKISFWGWRWRPVAPTAGLVKLKGCVRVMGWPDAAVNTADGWRMSTICPGWGAAMHRSGHQFSSNWLTCNHRTLFGCLFSCLLPLLYPFTLLVLLYTPFLQANKNSLKVLKTQNLSRLATIQSNNRTETLSRSYRNNRRHSNLTTLVY